MKSLHIKFVFFTNKNKNLVVYDYFFKNYERLTTKDNLINFNNTRIKKNPIFYQKYTILLKKSKNLVFLKKKNLFNLKTIDDNLVLKYLETNKDLLLKQNIYSFHLLWVYYFYNKNLILSIVKDPNFKLNYNPFFYNFGNKNLTKSLLFYKLNEYYSSTLNYTYIYKFRSTLKPFRFNKKDKFFLKRIKSNSVNYSDYSKDLEKIVDNNKRKTLLESDNSLKKKNIKSSFLNIVSRNMSVNHYKVSLIKNIRDVNYIYIFLLFLLVIKEQKKKFNFSKINIIFKILSLYFFLNSIKDFSYLFIEKMILYYILFYFKFKADYKNFYKRYLRLKFFLSKSKF